MNYSIVVPVYNGELTVKKLCDRINAYFATTNYTYEIIFVHDCGKDNSLQILKQTFWGFSKIALKPFQKAGSGPGDSFAPVLSSVAE